MPTVSGTFDVKLNPQPLADAAADPSLGRMALLKTFHGPLDATSRGEMLSASTTTPTSMAYVAIEHVFGTLDGRSGAFVLLHRGVIDRGQPALAVSVVPDSATGELTGLAGTMTLTPTHTYEFTYSLPIA